MPSTALTDSVAQFADRIQCGDRYKISATHWQRLVDRGEAPAPTRFGRLVRWSLRTLEEWEAKGCPRVDQGDDSEVSV